MKDAVLHLSDELVELLGTQVAVVRQEQVTRGQQQSRLPPAEFYATVLAQLEHIGWNRVADINQHLTAVQLKFSDRAGREHTVSASLPYDYPRSAPECTAAFPAAVALRWQPGATLQDVLTQYENAAELYQPLWTVLDDVDRNTWVLEPEHPTRDVTMRRIAIGSHASLQIDIDPRAPRVTPEWRLLGADSVVNPLREKFSANIEKWSEARTVRENFELLFELKFPSPSTSNKADFAGECAICYAYRLNGAVPDRVCDNLHCGKPFHRECLYEWLRALPTSRQSFDTVFGICPYCSQNITCKMPTAR